MTSKRTSLEERFFQAIEQHNTTLLMELLEQGANPNVKHHNGYTPLHWAITHRYTVGVKVLLEHGADANAVDGVMGTPLHWASANRGLEDIARLLIEHGADVNATDGAGKTPLDYAQQSGGSAMKEILRKATSRVSQQQGGIG